MSLDNENQNLEKEKKTKSIFTVETLGIILILFSALCLICVISGDKIFSYPGMAVDRFFVGLFGWASVIVLLAVGTKGFLLVTGNKIRLHIKTKIYFVAILVMLAIICQVATLFDQTMNYGEYLTTSYNNGSMGLSTCTGGGLVVGLVAYPLFKLLSNIGVYVVLGVAVVVFAYLFYKSFSSKPHRTTTIRGAYCTPIKTNSKENEMDEKEYPVDGVEFHDDISKPAQGLFINGPNSFNFKTKKEVKEEKKNLNSQKYSDAYMSELQRNIDYVKKPAEIDFSGKYNINNIKTPNMGVNISNVIPQKKGEIPFVVHDQTNTSSNLEIEKDSASSHANEFGKYLDYVEPEQTQPSQPIDYTKPLDDYIQPKDEDVKLQESEDKDFDIEEIKESNIRNIFEESEAKEVNGTTFESESFEDKSFENTPSENSFSDNSFEPSLDEIEDEKPLRKMPSAGYVYNRPSLDLLETNSSIAENNPEIHQQRQNIIKQTLEPFHIEVDTQGYIQGPSITRYEIKMPQGISVRRIVTLDNDLKMRLQSKDDVRIEAPIPGKDLVGVEVANEHRMPVFLKEVLEGMSQQKIVPFSLQFALGKNIVGNSVSDDLAEGPHYLVAGSTGSGKSICLHIMLVSLLMRYGPDELQLILIDPKRVEFRKYEGLPHLMLPEVITEANKVLFALDWAHKEMESRLEKFDLSHGEVSKISEYNEYAVKHNLPKMPRIVIVIDELADLMDACKKDLELKIKIIAQKSRAVGIHLVLATQRPSVDVITGTIKANLPSRIALKVSGIADSQTIMNSSGAEKLLGKGDMLYKNSTMPDYERYQGAYISNAEIARVVNYIKENNERYYDSDLAEYIEQQSTPKEDEEIITSNNVEIDDNDNLFIKALALGVQAGQISISALQRSFTVGWAKAGRLIDAMERKGYVEKYAGSKARKVLLSKEEFNKIYGDIGDIY